VDCHRELIGGGGSSAPGLPAQILHHYQQAAALDSTFVAPIFKMGYFYAIILGDWAAADSCIALVTRGRESLSPWLAIWADVCVGHTSGDPHRALRGYRRMADLDPDDVWVQYWIAFMARQLGRPEEALEALDRIDDAAMQDPKIGRNAYLFRCNAYHDLGQYERELETVTRAQEAFPGDWWLWGRNRIRPLVALGRIDEVHRTVDELMAIPQHPSRPGLILAYTIESLRASGYEDIAAAMADRAVAHYLARPAGDKETAWWRASMARSLYTARRWDEAHAYFEQLAADKPDELYIQGRLGTLAARRGDRKEAQRICDDLRQLDRRYLHGKHTVWCARIAALLGDRELAVDLLREALSQGAFNSFELRIRPCSDMEPLYGYEPFEELLRPKG
jgi:tetratricopeptide (TPR) repeat protein